ncbi:murein L,D-transpeptidase catalytic domain family protein [Marivirga sp. S37H4]|uniref:Murein L,D-transpeptidase catalytic domain family protein n=1 Tax=Marivirga aurantiaca TaxID=2802615 RepID=A0A934X289_9BACT|nr:murein L,D-transpeptidase catalytic domain family protein [Marivirga aurantiaca]MBK6267364.1 murein L,D-transpeptidase catalytic domain family protein [Marivirga aurantiaca]
MLKRFFTLLLTIPFFLNFTACSEKPDEATRIESEEEKLIHAEIDSLTQLRPHPKDMVEVDSIRKKEAYELSFFNSLDSFEDSVKSLYHQLIKKNPDVKLDFKPFRYALIGYYSLKQDERLNDKNIVSIIDFTKSSCDKRFYTIDLDQLDFMFYSLVSHGRNTGEDMARTFSNERSSNSSSLGFYVTGGTYTGINGYSMRLMGDEVGWNDNMFKRAVVMHEASYVSDDFVKRYGRLGRSYGCPALPKGLSRTVIDTIKNKTVIFAYYNDDSYLNASKYLDVKQLIDEFQSEQG